MLGSWVGDRCNEMLSKNYSLTDFVALGVPDISELVDFCDASFNGFYFFY